jgi:hypothetical protein
MSKRSDILERKKLDSQKDAMANEVNAQVKKAFNIYSLNMKAQNMSKHAPSKKTAPPVVEMAEDDEEVWESD